MHVLQIVDADDLDEMSAGNPESIEIFETYGAMRDWILNTYDERKYGADHMATPERIVKWLEGEDVVFGNDNLYYFEKELRS